MIRWALSGITILTGLAGGMLLWQSEFFPEHLPHSPIDISGAFFAVFASPLSALSIYGLTLLLAAASFCITDLLLGLVFSIVAAAVSVGCLIGMIGANYPPLVGWIMRFLA